MQLLHAVVRCFIGMLSTRDLAARMLLDKISEALHLIGHDS